jgi:Tol biopolymer transport system component
MSTEPNPVLRATHETVALSVQVVGDLAYVATGEQGIQLVDIRNPARPILTQVYDTPDVARSVQVQDDLIYVVDQEAGMQILRMTPTSYPGVIVFNSNRDGDQDIYRMNADGSDLQRITSNNARDGQADLSPDGSQVVFTSDENGQTEIYVMDVDGTNRRMLTDNTVINSDPVWSPDGRLIAYAHWGYSIDIYVMNADGTNKRRLTTDNSHNYNPSWSPDGTQIVFESSRDESQEIYVMNADGTNQRRLTNNMASDTGPSWSPDSRSITFLSDRDGDWEIYVMDVNGNDVRQLTNNTFREHSPKWSPDSHFIVFGMDNNGTRDIYVMDTEGNNQRNLTRHTAFDDDPSWALGSTTGTYSIMGYVVDDAGIPIENITISTDSGHHAITGATGMYMITSLPAGTYTLTPMAPDFAPASHTVTVPPDAEEVNFTATSDVPHITMNPAVSTLITLTITDRSGTVLADEPIEFSTDYGTVLPANTTTDAQGLAAVIVTAEDAPGTATITIKGRGITKRIEVQFGETPDGPALSLPLTTR